MRHPDNNNNNNSSSDDELERALLARGTGVEDNGLREEHLTGRPMELLPNWHRLGVLAEHATFLECCIDISDSLHIDAPFIRDEFMYRSSLTIILRDWNQSLSPRGISEERETSLNICLGDMETSIKVYSTAFSAALRSEPQAIQRRLPHNFNFTLLRIALEEKLNIQIIKQLIDWGCDVNAFDLTPPYDTLLHLAIRYDSDISVIKLLLDYGAKIIIILADTGMMAPGFNTPLHLTCMHSNVREMLSLFLTNQVRGEACFVANKAGNLPLHLAIQYEKPYCLKVILNAMLICRGKYMPSLDVFCDQSVGIHRANNKGHTPLVLAVNLYLIRVKYTYKYCARPILLACGLGSSAAEQFSRNIAEMVMRESLQSIRDLVAIGRADVCYTADPLQESPIDTALRSKNLDLVAALLNLGRRGQHSRLGHWLVANNCYNLVMRLSMPQNELVASDDKGRTPLFYIPLVPTRAVSPADFLRFLLSKQRTLEMLNQTDIDGKTALQYILDRLGTTKERGDIGEAQYEIAKRVIKELFESRAAQILGRR